jgi:hypothetical protein
MSECTVERLRKSRTTLPMDLPNSVSMYGTTEAKRIRWTLDLHLLPFVFLLYLLSSL